MQLEDLSLGQLYDLNDMICQRIDELRARSDLAVIKQLRLGQQVHFESRQEGRIFGKVVKINRKTVLVRSEDNRKWKLSAGLVGIIRDVD